MPVIGRGWYKRPYRLAYEWQGRKISKAYHWPGPMAREVDWLASNKIPYKAWVIRDEHGEVQLTERRWPTQ